MDRLLVRNLISMLLWQGGNYIIPLVTLPYLSRVLGVGTFGDVAFAYAIVAYFTLVTEWGFGLSATRLISTNAHDREAVNKIFWETLAAKCLLAALSLATLFATTMIIPSLYAIRYLVWAAAISVIANAITVNWCLQGLERLDFFAVGSLLGRALTIPLTLLLVHTPEDATVSIVIQAGCYLFSGVLSVYLLARTNYIKAPAASLKGAYAQLLHGGDVFLSTAAVNFYTTTNIVILGSLSDNTGVGNYSGADRIKTAAQGVISPVGNAVYPRVARLMAEDPARAFRFLDWLFLIQGLVTLVISLVLFWLAPLAVRIILGVDYVGAVPILHWLAWLPFVIGLSNIFGLQVLLQTGKQRLFSRIIMSAVPISLTLVFSLVHVFGPVGAAMATVLTEIYVLVLMAYYAIRDNPRLFLPLRRRFGMSRPEAEI